MISVLSLFIQYRYQSCASYTNTAQQSSDCAKYKSARYASRAFEASNSCGYTHSRYFVVAMNASRRTGWLR